MSWSALFRYVAIYILERMVDHRLCRIRDATLLIGGTHGRIGEPH